MLTYYCHEPDQMQTNWVYIVLTVTLWLTIWLGTQSEMVATVVIGCFNLFHCFFLFVDFFFFGGGGGEWLGGGRGWSGENVCAVLKHRQMIVLTADCMPMLTASEEDAAGENSSLYSVPVVAHTVSSQQLPQNLFFSHQSHISQSSLKTHLFCAAFTSSDSEINRGEAGGGGGGGGLQSIGLIGEPAAAAAFSTALCVCGGGGGGRRGGGVEGVGGGERVCVAWFYKCVCLCVTVWVWVYRCLCVIILWVVGCEML